MSVRTNTQSVYKVSCNISGLHGYQEEWFKPKAMLKVTYVGEPAVDDGGPKREFFTGNFSKLRMAYKCCGSNFSLV